MDIVKIEFFNESGCMNHTNLVLDAFFPTSHTRINALFKKFIEKSDDKVNITREILQYLYEHCAICTNEQSLKMYANEYADMVTKQHELSDEINQQQGLIIKLREAKDFPQNKNVKKYYTKRVKEKSVKLKNLKDKLSAAKSCGKLAYRSFCSLQRDGERYKNNITWVRQAAWWWTDE